MTIVGKNRWVAADGTLYTFRTTAQAKAFLDWLQALKPAPVKVRQKGKGSKSAHFLKT